MPTYEYVCRSCGHEMEAFQSMKDAPLVDCPACGESALQRRIGRGAGILFKGSGFYQTDYKSTGSESKKEGGGDNKPASPSTPPAAAGTSSPAPAT